MILFVKRHFDLDSADPTLKTPLPQYCPGCGLFDFEVALVLIRATGEDAATTLYHAFQEASQTPPNCTVLECAPVPGSRCRIAG